MNARLVIMGGKRANDPAGLSDSKPELEQFAMNVRCTPKHILNAHPPNQCPQFRTDWRMTFRIARFPTPVTTKASTMPAHQRLGPDDRDGTKDRRKPSIQQNKNRRSPVVSSARPLTCPWRKSRSPVAHRQHARRTIWPTAARPCRPRPLRVAAPLPGSIPDANRSVIYEFAMDSSA